MKQLINIFLFCIIFCFSSLCVYSATEEETLIIFDASVSMLEKFKDEPKYIIAIDEAKNVLKSYSNSKNIGLRTIGVTVDENLLNLIKSPADFCKATKLVVPIRQNNIHYINNALDSVFPLGTTPLTYTLKVAISYDFSYSSRLKHIVLITDGGESCNEDPCKFIREIMNTRKDIKIDIIAIGVNADDFKQLKCLTDYTSGEIINAVEPDDLKRAFNQFLNPDSTNYSHIETMPALPPKDDIIYKNYLIETLE